MSCKLMGAGCYTGKVEVFNSAREVLEVGLRAAVAHNVEGAACQRVAVPFGAVDGLRLGHLRAVHSAEYVRDLSLQQEDKILYTYFPLIGYYSSVQESTKTRALSSASDLSSTALAISSTTTTISMLLPGWMPLIERFIQTCNSKCNSKSQNE